MIIIVTPVSFETKACSCAAGTWTETYALDLLMSDITASAYGLNDINNEDQTKFVCKIGLLLDVILIAIPLSQMK